MEEVLTSLNMLFLYRAHLHPSSLLPPTFAFLYLYLLQVSVYSMPLQRVLTDPEVYSRLRHHSLSLEMVFPRW